VIRSFALAVVLVACSALPIAAAPFAFDDVRARAQALASKPFEPPPAVPEWLTEITYDQWRDIRYRPEATLWAKEKLPFQVQFFHPGLFYDHPVTINVVDAKGAVAPVPFSPSRFDYGKNEFASRVPQDLGYAGFRVHAPIKTPRYFDEFVVFLGASYFRAVGQTQGFGLSARGLAIDTAAPSGEEFPAFREFWLVTPAPQAAELTVYALLDSPRITGAYRFVLRPGEQTQTQVDVSLYLRREVEKVGLAPLTSMFFHGENSLREFEDFRPEAHDSDGLLIYHGAGEWLWRPLDNPRALDVRGLHAMSLRGFGLLQRDREFGNYQDLESHYEQRPSTWVVPHGDWGSGRVELVQIPTKSDTNDNIVAFWRPAVAPRVGEPFHYGYTIYWYGDDPSRPPAGRVVSTRRGRGQDPDARRFVVDFDGKRLRSIPDTEVLRGDVTIASEEDIAELLDQQVVKNPVTGGWRLTFQVRPKGKDPVELRAFLDKGGDTLTETWSYSLDPQR